MTANGYRFATSIGGVLTGRGGNMIIIDELSDLFVRYWRPAIPNHC